MLTHFGTRPNWGLLDGQAAIFAMEPMVHVCRLGDGQPPGHATVSRRVMTVDGQPPGHAASFAMELLKRSSLDQHNLCSVPLREDLVYSDLKRSTSGKTNHFQAT